MGSRLSTKCLAKLAEGNMESATQRRLDLIDGNGRGTDKTDVGRVSMRLEVRFVELLHVSYNLRQNMFRMVGWYSHEARIVHFGC